MLLRGGSAACTFVGINHAAKTPATTAQIPVFGTAEDRRMLDRARAAVAQGDFEAAFAALQPSLAQPPFSPVVRNVIMDQVNRIIATEAARGEIPRPPPVPPSPRPPSPSRTSSTAFSTGWPA